MKEVIRLHFESKLGINAIARMTKYSNAAVSKLIARAKELGISWPLPKELQDESKLKSKFRKKKGPKDPKLDIDYAYIDKELSKKAVTLALLHEELSKGDPDFMSYSHFCRQYKSYANKPKLSMKQVHKAGDTVYVDYSGMKFDIIDPDTDEVRSAEIFIAAMGYSGYVFAIATWSQNLEDWMYANMKMLEYFGGIPKQIVVDNLKSGVKHAHIYEPDINPQYSKFAEHYSVAISPTRAYRPKDKAKVEDSVKLSQRWILAKLRNVTIFGLDELNIEIMKLLKDVNAKSFRKKVGTRESLFNDIDKPALSSLPKHRYEYKQYKTTKAGLDYHVYLEGHYYSVPYQYADMKLDIWYNNKIVEIYHNGLAITKHVFSSKVNDKTTIKDHMPRAHKEQHDLSVDIIKSKASNIGNFTSLVVKSILEANQSNANLRAAQGIININKSTGNDKLESACRYAHFNGINSYKSIKNIIKNNLDTLPTDTLITNTQLIHENIRGPQNYK